MIRQCNKCKVWYEDVYRDAGCPHDAFPANDGNNNFKVNTAAYLSATKPPDSMIFQAHGDT
jgi:hypothetical protein